jgi:hypothetical protein
VTLDNALLVAAIAAEFVVLVLLLWGGTQKNLPMFCAYIAWNLLTDISNFVVIYRFPHAYVQFGLIEIVPDSLIQFAVLIELAWSTLRPSRSVLPRGVLYVLILLVGLAGLAIWPLAAMTLPANLTPHAQLFVHFQETIAILRVACFLVMAGFSQILSIGWKNRELQVATGLGFYSIVSLLVTVLHSHQLWQDPSYSWLDRAVVVCYVGTMSYWAFSFATKEQQRKEFSPQMQQFLVYMGGGARASRIALSDLPSERPSKRI